jgi:GNAT superfamily N-acetyltransferase
MRTDDLGPVNTLADRIHINYPEEPIVFREKLQLFPFGCFTLEAPNSDVAGYCFSHPWTRGMPPVLDTLLRKLPKRPSTYFLHDLAVDEPLRGKQMATMLFPILVTVARLWRLDHMMLIAVNKSEGFWLKRGFTVTPDNSLQEAVRAKYSDEAIHMELNVDLHF